MKRSHGVEKIQEVRAQRCGVTAWTCALALTAWPAFGGAASAEDASAAQPSDATITSHVRQSLARDDRLRSSRLHISTRNGVVMLIGSVDDEEAQRAAESVARRVAGVRAVIGGHAAVMH